MPIDNVDEMGKLSQRHTLSKFTQEEIDSFGMSVPIKEIKFIVKTV